jgi:ADP-ribose pyrophosphatase YjhB (NUDIX family)
MKFCSECGQSITRAVPTGDNRERYVCTQCGTVHYQNPLIVAGCVPVHEGRILLCKRAIEPRLGYWTVPAGFMELGETVAAAAAREAREEAVAEVQIGALLAVIDVVQARQVHVFFEAGLASPEFAAGDETLEAGLYAPDEIPWDDIAFTSVRLALERHLANRGNGGHCEVLMTAVPKMVRK